jgi:hypothetical protein
LHPHEVASAAAGPIGNLENLTPERLERILAEVRDATFRGEYVHWDKLGHLNPPRDLTHAEWWFGLKLRRQGAKPISLEDKTGSNFVFNVVDPLPESLHHVDSLAFGAIRQPEPLTNPATRDRYLVRSLIEESITSSQLEGASTTREVAKKMLREGREPRDRSERMILNNYRTMQFILELKNNDISTDMILEVHRMVTDGTLDDATAAGRFRRSDENIVVGGDPGEVLHVPPPATELKLRMERSKDTVRNLRPRNRICGHSGSRIAANENS